MAPVEDDEDGAVATMAEAPPENDDDDDEDVPGDDDDDEDEAVAPADKFAAFEGKVRRIAAKRLKAYTDKLNESTKTKIENRRKALDEYISSRLDDWTMQNVGTDAVQNPERVAETLVRQAAAAEARIKSIRDQLSALEAGGVAVTAIRERLAATAAE